MRLGFLQEDRGQVSTEQILLLTAVIGAVLVVGYVVKTGLKGLSKTEKGLVNETFNKSI